MNWKEKKTKSKLNFLLNLKATFVVSHRRNAINFKQVAILWSGEHWNACLRFLCSALHLLKSNFCFKPTFFKPLWFFIGTHTGFNGWEAWLNGAGLLNPQTSVCGSQDLNRDQLQFQVDVVRLQLQHNTNVWQENTLLLQNWMLFSIKNKVFGSDLTSDDSSLYSFLCKCARQLLKSNLASD